MAPRGKTHALGILKLEEKTHIHDRKEERVSSEKISKQLGRHRSLINRPGGKKSKSFPMLVTHAHKTGSEPVRKKHKKALIMILKSQELK
jgi:IS30 family transposase